MTTFTVFALMIASIPWMLVVTDYHHYHRLTVQKLANKTIDTYCLDGLINYAQAYYRRHKKTLLLSTYKKIIYPPAGKQSISFILIEPSKEGTRVYVRIETKERVLEKEIIFTR